MANSPAAFGVAIYLADTGVHPEPDRSNESRLTQVGTKTRPEVVIQVRPSMEGSGVKRNPMSDRTEERDKKGKSDDAKHEQKTQDNLLRVARTTVVGVRYRPVPVS